MRAHGSTRTMPVRSSEMRRNGDAHLEVLVGELLAVDGLAARAVVVGEVTALAHELRDDAVERGALEAKALLASAKRTEVLRRLQRRACGWPEVAVVTRQNTSLRVRGEHCRMPPLACQCAPCSLGNRGACSHLGDDVGAKLHDNAAGLGTADGDVEEDLRVAHYVRYVGESAPGVARRALRRFSTRVCPSIFSRHH